MARNTLGSAKDKLRQKFRKEKPASLAIQDDRTKVVTAPLISEGLAKKQEFFLG